MNKNKTQDNKQNDLDKPDPGTLHTTDPQQHMEGPVSSLVQEVREISEKNNKDNKKDKYEKS